MTGTLCGSIVSSRRGLLAFLWSCISILTALAFLIAFLVALSADYNPDNYGNNYNNNCNGGEGNEGEEGGQRDGCGEEDNAEIGVTSRALVFTALWTACLAAVMAIFGSVILGIQSPTGDYYTCCNSSIHRTTPLGLGSFIGALLMFSNCTLVCSVLFGEFQIRDYIREGEDRNNGQGEAESSLETASVAFSIMCMFLTVVYAGFAAFTFASSHIVIAEFDADARGESLYPQSGSENFHSGYIDQRFDVKPNSGFVPPSPTPTSDVHQSHYTGNHFNSSNAFVAPQPHARNYLESNPFASTDSTLS